MKVCTECGEAKPLDSFNRRAASRDGRRSMCRDCDRARDERRCADPGYKGQRSRVQKARRDREPEKYAAETGRRRARHRTRLNTAASEWFHGAQADTLPGATNWRKEWTGPELEVAARPDLTAKEAARLLGRTAAGVRAQRHLMVVDPRKVRLAGLSLPAGGR